MAETTNKCPYPTCGCVGYAYVPVQEFEENYSPCNALVQGTLFPELDLNIYEYGKVCKKWGGVSYINSYDGIKSINIIDWLMEG